MINTQRAHSLDALRGTAILLMVLSGILPYTLPHWMFHAQVPPGQGFNPLLPGITWVDLVFPFFLFVLGAAMPFAFERRLNAQKPFLSVSGHIIERSILLVFFAIFIQHIRPYNLTENIWGSETAFIAWLLGLAGFAILFMIYLRAPRSWPLGLKVLLKILGWAGALSFLILMKYPDGSGFKFQRMDIIIMLLANMVFFGSIIYILTRNNPLARLAVMAVFIGMRLVHMQWDISLAIGGQEAVKNIPYIQHLFNGVNYSWLDKIWDYSPAKWLYNFSWLKYLLIVLPGTIAGDQIKTWLQKRRSVDEHSDKAKLIVLSIYALVIVGVSLVGLYTRHVFSGSIIIFVLCSVAWLQIRKPNTNDEKLLKKLVVWGSMWLILGLIFEPFGGGIKKDNSTLSYYFLTAGLAYYMLVFFSIWIDILKKKSIFNLLIQNGQNPMIAYVGMMNLLVPVLYISFIFPWLKDITHPYPWVGFLLSCAQTLILALIVGFFTRKKLFWRT
jgi:predicted acyltransferase